MKYFVEKEDFIFNTRVYQKYVMTIMILKRKR